MRPIKIELPVASIELLSELREDRHVHPSAELVYLLDGSGTCESRAKAYTLQKDDVVVWNANEVHKLETAEGTVLCRLYLEQGFLSANAPGAAFACNTAADAGRLRPYGELRTLLRRIALQSIAKPRKSTCLLTGLLYELLDCLLEQFQAEQALPFQTKKDGENQKLQFLLDFVNANYQNPIRLNDLAQKFYTSTSTLSRFFKRQTGLYFGEYLNSVRLDHAAHALSQTDKTVTRIAVECGFTNASAFSRPFQTTYGMPPTAYRKERRTPPQSQTPKTPPDVLKAFSSKLQKLAAAPDGNGAQTAALETAVEIANAAGTPYRRSWNQILNVGAAYNLTLANVQYHILYLAEHLRFSYARIWNIFSDKFHIQQNPHDRRYNFNELDSVLDFLVEHRLKPFLDFGLRPDCAIRTDGEMVYYEEGNLLYESFESWKSLFSAFLAHIVKRYGREEASQWQYELSLDVRTRGLSFRTGPEDLTAVYRYSADALRHALPGAKIGGLGTISDTNGDLLFDWLEASKRADCLPDFISMLAFPYTQAKTDGHFYAKRVSDQDWTPQQILHLRHLLDERGFSECELYVTECNLSLSNRNYINDSCARGTYLLHLFNKIWDVPDKLGVWMGTDWVSSYYDTARVANGGSGLITKDGIRKPIYYALSFLNALGPRFLQKGEGYIATTHGPLHHTVLLYNIKTLRQDYFLHGEDELKLQTMDTLFEDLRPRKITLTFTGLPEGQVFLLKRETVNAQHGSVLDAWGRLQFEKDLSGSDVKYLRDTCVPELTLEKQRVENGRLTYTCTLQAHEISVLDIYTDT